MKSGPRNLLVLGGVAICLYAYDHRYGYTKILDGRGVVAVNRYADEFATLLHVVTHWNTGQPLSEPIFFLPLVSGPLASPDSAFSLSQKHNLRDGYHTLTLSRPGDQTETVLTIQEADPGSGTSHRYHWSQDSKAVFVYGSGRPAGGSLLLNAALVYLVDQKQLYSLDLAPILAERLKRERK